MGMSYYVRLHVQLNNEQGAVQALKKFVMGKGIEGKTEFNVELFAKEGVYPDTLDGLLQIIMAGWKSTGFRKKILPEYTLVYENAFDCCYGWECVLQDMFEVLLPYISDKSQFLIYTDESCYIIKIGYGDGGVRKMKFVDKHKS